MAAIGLVIVIALTAGTVIYLVGTMIRSIQVEMRSSDVTRSGRTSA